MTDLKYGKENSISGGLSRRELLRQIALGLTAMSGPTLTLEAAGHVHQEVKQEKISAGNYKSKLLTEHEFQTLCQLAELIMPADEISGSGREAGAPEFIDLLCSQNQELAGIFTGGLLWLDATMRRCYGMKFSEATTKQQTSLLDSLVSKEQSEEGAALIHGERAQYRDFSSYGSTDPANLGAGVIFLGWVRKLVVDAYYTSEIGIKDLGYVGNSAMARYEVPQGIVDLLLQRSPLGPAGNVK
jgi:gluconate 2-dehydrogenase gamma chain